jgi:pimeloyl-ACP methyl ester carboxylesterase
MSSFRIRCVLMIVVAMLGNGARVLSAAESRSWTALSGRTVTGEFIEFKDGDVVLRTADQKRLAIKLTMLSAADRHYIEKAGVIPADQYLRTWTSASGKTLEADLVSHTEERVVLRQGDKQLEIPLDKLAASDRDYLRQLREAALVKLLDLAGVTVLPGKMITFRVPLPADAAHAAAEGGNPQPTEATIGLAVPADFDPRKPWPVLCVSATSDGHASSVGHMRGYWKTATDLGWVVIAGDGPSKPATDHDAWRWTMLSAGLEAMHKAWPDSRKWLYATGGFSGGAKRSGRIGAILAKEKYRLIGIFMGGCNADMPSDALKTYKPAKADFLNVPIFLSNGEADAISTPAAAENVRRSLEKTGFTKVRYEKYAGGHSLHPDHIREALTWFQREAASAR